MCADQPWVRPRAFSFPGSEGASWLVWEESLDWTSGAGGSEEQPAAPIAQHVY